MVSLTLRVQACATTPGSQSLFLSCTQEVQTQPALCLRPRSLVSSFQFEALVPTHPVRLAPGSLQLPACDLEVLLVPTTQVHILVAALPLVSIPDSVSGATSGEGDQLSRARKGAKSQEKFPRGPALVLLLAHTLHFQQLTPDAIVPPTRKGSGLELQASVP